MEKVKIIFDSKNYIFYYMLLIIKTLKKISGYKLVNQKYFYTFLYM